MDSGPRDVPDFPRLRPNVDFAFVADGSVLVRGPGGSLSLRGEFVTDVLPALLSRLNGDHHRQSLDDVVGQAFRPEFESFLRILTERRFLADDLDGPDDGRCASWGLHGDDARAAQARLVATRVLVAGPGRVARALAQALTDGGVGHVSQVPRSSLADPDPGSTDGDAGAGRPTAVVLASDRMSLFGVDQVNAFSQRTGVPWLLVRIDRCKALIGPYVLPGQTACFACYELRARANADRPAEHEALFQTWRSADDPPDSNLVPPEYAAMLGNWLALDLMRTLATGRMPVSAGRILELDLQTLASSTRDILRLPRCPACSRQRAWPLTRIWDIPRSTPGQDVPV